MTPGTAGPDRQPQHVEPDDGGRVHTPDRPYCFLITSFEESLELQTARSDGINPAAGRFGFPVFRIDEVASSASIIDTTRQLIAGAYFVVADLTGDRPNCYYEVGYAHALDRPVIAVIQHPQTPHFDLNAQQFIRYRTAADLKPALERRIEGLVLTSRAPSDDADDNAGRFARKAFVDPFIVTGRIRPNRQDIARHKLTFFLDVTVRSLDAARPLTGPVTFFMHRSFAPRERSYTIDVSDGSNLAVLTDVWITGTFTVGITIKKSGVNLELDLAHLPGATPEFRSR